MTDPKPLWHRAIPNPSDHNGYIAGFELPNGSTLVIGTINLSVEAVKRRPIAVRTALVKLALATDVLIINEAGAARAIVTEAARITQRLTYFGDGRPGQASTPLLVARGLGARFTPFPLTGRRHVADAAAGPAITKPKWLMVAHIDVDGEDVNVAGLHATPSTRFRLNYVTAALQFTRSAKVLHQLAGLSFAGGDLNQNMLGKLLAILRPWRRHAHMRSSQRALGPVATHGKRAIDDVYFEVNARRHTHH